MNLWRKVAVVPLLLVLVALPLVGCGGSDAQGDGEDGQVVLRFSWWGSQERHDRTLKVIELFEKANPNIKIEPEFSGWDGYWDKRATQAAGGNLPDVIQMDSKYLAEYVNRELLLDLNPYVEDGTIDLSDVEENLISGGIYDEKLVAISMGANAKGMVVDPELYKKGGVPLPKPGSTWEDFMEEARKLKKGLGDKYYVEAPISMDAFRYYLRGQGQSLFDETGTKLNYDDQKLVDFFTMWDQLRKEDVLVPGDVLTQIAGPEDELIVHGKAPNDERWSNQFVAVASAADRPLELVMFPLHSADDKKSYYLKPSMFMSVSARTKHPKEAAQFIDFLTNSEEAYDILVGERGVPISNKIREYIYPKLDEMDKMVFDFVELVGQYAGDVEKDPQGTGPIWNAFDREFQSLVYGKVTPEQAAKNFRKEAETNLKRNK